MTRASARNRTAKVDCGVLTIVHSPRLVYSMVNGPGNQRPDRAGGSYLSRQHFEDVENSCPMVALPTDVAPSFESIEQFPYNQSQTCEGSEMAQSSGLIQIASHYSVEETVRRL